MWHRILIILALLTTLRPPTAAADELIVDNASPGVQVAGPWTQTALTGGFNGADYLYRPASGGDATVFWPFPSTAPGGRYEVFARWTSGPNRASNALYWIASEGGTVSLTRNQQSNGGSWQSLGSFDFTPGKQQGVTLSDKADGVVIADAIRWMGPSTTATTPAPPQPPQPAPAAPQPQEPAPAAAPAAQPPSQQPDPNAVWTVALDATDLHAGPDTSTDILARVPQFSYLQVLGYAGDWAYVYNPRARGTAYAPSMLLGPSDLPPAWVTAAPPKPLSNVEQMGRVVGNAPVAFYPVDDKFAITTRLSHNQPILVHDKLTGADGSTWYRVDQGYLAASSIRLPRTPERTFSGRWIDADLSEPAMVTAYEGDRIVLSTLAIKGTVANATPTGVFAIQRRVEDETMDSGTLAVPIPPNGPGGYHLEHVLYTQYFSADGASIHYNYWSSNFGYSGSHGCLGLNRSASEFFWNWATIGTLVVIHI